MSKVNIVGNGGHSRVIRSFLTKSFDVFDDIPGKDVCGSVSDLVSGDKGDGFIVAIGNNGVRRDITKRLLDAGHKLSHTVMHPNSSYCGLYLGSGGAMMAGSVFSVGARAGNGLIANHNAVIDHDCILGDFVHVAPGATLAGGASVGDCTLIGAGARVKEGIKIGSGVMVGMGAVVINDVPDNATVVGVPARPIN